MAQTITSFSIVEVAKPNIGESWPARVRADVTVNLNVQDHIKHEWEGDGLCVSVHHCSSFLLAILEHLSFVHHIYFLCLSGCFLCYSRWPMGIES